MKKCIKEKTKISYDKNTKKEDNENKDHNISKDNYNSEFSSI